MANIEYELPTFLHDKITRLDYCHWLESKARSHVNRDRRRGNQSASVRDYKKAIHKATLDSCGNDMYTGKPLKWQLIHKYNNAKSKRGGRKYKKSFADLPTIDHGDEGKGPPNFKICSWRINDSKHDLTLKEFLAVCKEVVDFNIRQL